MEQLGLEGSLASGDLDQPSEDHLEFKRRYDQWKAKADEEPLKRQKLQ
jgi:hypothetical protein